MKRQEFYTRALLDKAYMRKDWVIGVFAVTRKPKSAMNIMPAEPGAVVSTDQLWDVRYNVHNTEVLVPTEAGPEWVIVEDATPMTPLCYPADPLTVTPEMIPNCRETVESTYGDLLFNWIVLVEPFEHRIDYQVGPCSISAIERIIAKLLVDDPEVSGVEPSPDQIPVKMYMRFGRCTGALAGFVQIFVPTLTPKSLMTDPRVREVRAKRLEEHADRLHDPVVVSRIQNELIDMDREWVKDDPSEGFLLSNKTFGTARKRMFLIHGPEAGFNEGGSAELVVNSLNEGWDTTKIVSMYNSTRAGSFYRGALTALGGEAVKFFMRVFQNTSIAEDDCGSTLGITRWIDPGQGAYYAGLWEITKNGVELMTEERAKQFEGKFVLTRSPMYCKTEGAGFCAKCAGEALAALPFGLAAENTSVASKFMDIMMASAHAKELKTAKLDFEKAFT